MLTERAQGKFLSYPLFMGFCMILTTFDTDKFACTPQELASNEKQSEGLTDTMRADIDESELATRRHLKEMKPRIAMQLELPKGDISLIKWMLGGLIVPAIAKSKQF